MRIVVALVAGVSTLALGFIAISQQIQDVEPTGGESTNYNVSFDLSTNMIEGIGTVTGQSVVWMGVAAFILVACVLAVVMVPGGRY